ncbi:MAG: tRNA glutamyl-Q(34) synthetase GluQRS [endosymbiont of Galathealinum brachiosum]|uniref:Glutamyl-Q tRNA(Asp) synthetase n=1 Tax=endosymbiont of Galathealinum brachiosum TaxID=2200906 RepID=A0A370DIQ8_9GAMM|nr:MAG: tRNA glutamyl-Q(34) synthetase GluQRS [endosymbiont of Galathealinum brachiosum]
MTSTTNTYRGRFAPSPTGPLHKGSLVAAVASYLEAKKYNGQWLVRMEDVDELRNVKGAADSILRSIEAFGFEWDEDILYQTQRKEAYAEALQQLKEQNLIYPCTCSRKSLKAKAASGEITSGQLGVIYPGFCTNNNFSNFKTDEYAIRIKVLEQKICFDDELLGANSQNLKADSGDFIIRRRDALFAYQLAVVVDDAFQNITHVVRGVDLLDSTVRQLYLQQCLKYNQLQYAHLPLIVHANGDKLSKQTGAQSIGDKADIPLLVECLEFLGQNPPKELERDSLNNVWCWAMENWELNKINSAQD